MSDDDEIAFVVYENEAIVVIDLKTDDEIYSNYISNIRNVVVNERTLYFTKILEAENLINVKDQSTVKKMQCYKIMTSNSKLYDINTNGFSVITDNMLYEVRKG